LPPWSDGSCLVEYIPQAQEALEETFKTWLIRREFVVSIIKIFGTPLEYDSLKFRKLSFYVQTNASFIFILRIKIAVSFPKEMPALVVQSFQHYKMPGPRPIVQTFNNYPYSPRWPAPEMANRIKKFLNDEVKNIKKLFEETQKHSMPSERRFFYQL